MDNTNQTIATLLHVMVYLNRSVPIPFLIFGTIGNALNIFILTRKSLQKNSCAFYFLSSTIANIVSLWTGLLTRLLSGYNIDPTVSNTIACKFRFYIAYMSLSLSAFFLVYASIDRWASSSTNAGIRLFGRIHVARRIVIYTSLFSSVFYLEVFYCYETVLNQFPLNCYSPNQICRVYNDILFLILVALIPPMFMLGFGFRTIRHVKRTRQQIRSSTCRTRLMKKKDHQMMIMLLVQVIFFVVCVTPSAISKSYTTLTLNQSKDPLKLTKENFLFQLSVLILYLNCCSAFYIYTLSGRIFRREVKRLIPRVHRTNSTTDNKFVSHQISMAYYPNQNDLILTNVQKKN